MSGSHDSRQLMDIFGRVDQDGSGLIDATELQNALSLGGIEMSVPAAAQLIRLHDRDNNGKIDFKEFVSLNKFLTDNQNIFFRNCTPGEEKLTTAQLRDAVSEVGYDFLEPPAFQAVCDAFDPNRESVFDLTVFYSIIAFLKATISTFRCFDAHRTGQVTMNMNQFVYAAAFTR